MQANAKAARFYKQGAHRLLFKNYTQAVFAGLLGY